jgi:hypothetical protein
MPLKRCGAPCIRCPQTIIYSYLRKVYAVLSGAISGTVRLLRDGIARNKENPIMNRDMQMVVDEILNKPEFDMRDGSVLSVHFLFQSAIR